MKLVGSPQDGKKILPDLHLIEYYYFECTKNSVNNKS